VVERLRMEVLRILGAVTAFVSPNDLVQLCGSLGIPERASLILNGSGNGWVLKSYLDASGEIPIDIFCSWWHSQTLGDGLQTFFRRQFPGSTLVEHQGEHFRFQVPKHAIRPYAVFGQLERSKDELHVSEYGVSETSLEHIFNNMAAQQDEEHLDDSEVCYDSDGWV